MNIGTIDIDRPIILAPMEDVTDLPFRLMCKRLGADLMYTEFVNAEGLVRQSEKTKKKMLFLDEERPFGIQIYGGVESSMEGAAHMAEALNPDLIDINCGCWVKNVVGSGAGAGLLKDLPKMERIVSSVVHSVQKPVTVKTRLGWDQDSIRIVDVAKMLEANGVQGLTVHCRTRAQGHKGVPDYSWIPKIKKTVSIPIFVNGGLATPEQIENIFRETGCDGVMIGQGAIDNPWIFQQTKYFRRTGEPAPPLTWDERIRVCIEHLRFSVEYKGERTGVLEMRKHYSGYLRGISNVSKLRTELMKYTEMNPVIELLSAFHYDHSLHASSDDTHALV